MKLNGWKKKVALPIKEHEYLGSGFEFPLNWFRIQKTFVWPFSANDIDLKLDQLCVGNFCGAVISTETNSPLIKKGETLIYEWALEKEEDVNLLNEILGEIYE